MAVSLATLQAKRDALVLAMSSGERTVSYADRRVEYRSVEEMAEALAFLDSQIEAAGGAARADRTSYGYVKR